jgi:hypothetical protein
LQQKGSNYDIRSMQNAMVMVEAVQISTKAPDLKKWMNSAA